MTSAETGPPASAPTVVEARGVLCPVPIIRLARVTRTLPPGSLVEVLSDDPAAAFDIPAWCRLRGHELLETEVAAAPDHPPSETSAAHSGTDAGVPPGNEPEVGAPAAPVPLRHLIRVGPRPGG